MRTTGRSLRLLVIVLACGLLVGAGVGWHVARGQHARVVGRAGVATGWQTIEYDGVTVDLPARWRRRDMGACEFEFERWGPPGSDPCAVEAAGLAFYADATFDPAGGPGVTRAADGRPGVPAWEGYVIADDVAVYASDDDRTVVAQILRSVGSDRTADRSPS